MTFHEQIKALLFKYEMAEQEVRAIKNEYESVFEKLAQLETLKEEARDAMKRLLYTKNGPPDEVPLGQKQHVWGKGHDYKVVVTYKKHADFYDPKKLPNGVICEPGVVTAVDKAICDVLAAKDRRVKAARVEGEWMTPSLSISRLHEE